MTNKTIKILALALLLCGSTTPMQAGAFTSTSDWGSFAFTVPGGYNEILGYGQISVKRGQPYDETKDPALRKSTDNSNVLPWGALIMPVIIFLAFIFVFYRKKDLD